MCVPQPQNNAAPPSQVPSMQAADNLQLGGQGTPRGAAQLGRLQLRLNGSPGGDQPVSKPPPSAPVPQAQASPGSPQPTPAGTFAASPNMALRLSGSGRL